jgi:DNA-binding MarR family transcriptional regulator
MTTVIDRLEQAGYARRRADPADRRRVIVEPTELLAQRDAEIFGRLIRSTEALVGAYSDADLAIVRDFLSRARATIACHAESLLQQSRVGHHRSSARADGGLGDAR